MARPILFHAPAKAETSNAEQLGKVISDHAEALQSACELLQVLHDKGILELLHGMVAASDDLIATVSRGLDTPESIRAIRNVIVVTRLLGSIPPEKLSKLAQAVESGFKGERSRPAPGLLHLLGRLRSEESRRAAAFGLDVLESLGKSL